MILDTPLAALLITILIALVGAAVGYGTLLNKVNSHSTSIEKLEASYTIIDQKLDTICNQVARVETVLKERKG